MTERVRVTETEDFLPRFDSIEKDFDRLMEHVAELARNGRIEKVPGKSLHDVYIQPAERRILDAYFDRRLYAELERFWTGPDVLFRPPHEYDRAGWERLAREGQPQRAIRLWRNHLAGMKPPFWFRVKERNRGSYFASPYDNRPVADQIADYDEIVAQLPEKKAILLATMDQARDYFLQINAPQSQLDRLARERAEIAAEKRTPPGKPDPRPMDLDVFWEVIGTLGEEGISQQLDDITVRLSRFKAAPIKSFDMLLHKLNAQAYRNDIWALAYLLRDGCSDDRFEDFRYWLILQGRARFEAVLADPDAFDVESFHDDIEGCAMLWDAPLHAYDIRTGKPMKRKTLLMPQLAGPELEENDFTAALPRIAAALKLRA